MNGRRWYPHASLRWQHPRAPGRREHDQSGRSNNQLSAPMLMPPDHKPISKRVAKRNDRPWGVVHSANINPSNHRPTQKINLSNIGQDGHHWFLSWLDERMTLHRQHVHASNTGHSAMSTKSGDFRATLPLAEGLPRGNRAAIG